ncbi:MAG TPA: bifunctional riboflavin kinase/FAD synthetase [Bacillota bacterium]|nr:bifunctional riboflavin kinase/FAD synthetase [Bacillota bacterium]HPF42454.1 bifunctional riboflavin kinase/FAD synthetase [Bacillota bacterium]HPJ85712.1 bifunctional riboflavin kinase/FAD synthetase [Bacillota bacterium]HPQ61651.1 bifunctional riboflavin kinase/FAD synthetase [Bacillota bacterium]HRX92124.1 bifunctional riboflavin kinase/FAD synthetase [Candidatus Izemoplasmatales bacterium]
MKKIILDSTARLEIPNLTLAAGFFDGMHLAHQKLLETARDKGHPNGMLTLSEHIPSLLGNRKYQMLTTLSDKEEIASMYGLDYFIVLEVDRALIELTPEDFAFRYLSSCKTIIVGFDFSFGRHGSGKPQLLEKLFPGKVEVVPEMQSGGEKIGSTRIKQYLESGDIEKANNLLGRPYRIKGTIVKGHRRGHVLGYPTANVDYKDYILPLPGVYMTKTTIENESFFSLTNIGDNPTFSDRQMTLESHLFGFGRESYNETAMIDFLAYLRPEIRFDTPEELKKQVEADEMKLKKAIENGRIK